MWEMVEQGQILQFAVNSVSYKAGDRVTINNKELGMFSCL